MTQVRKQGGVQP